VQGYLDMSSEIFVWSSNAEMRLLGPARRSGGQRARASDVPDAATN
jgi:hypothetical protein